MSRHRKLASVQYIHDVTPIEGADAIECAHVLGWQVVTKKGEFSVGDIGVYFEIDSFLPIRPEFEFLRKSSYKKTDLMGEGFRLRTARLRGQLSQGLLLPMSILPEEEYAIGDDVTEVLGVRKFEIEERATTGGNVKGLMPYDIPKTDELRIQSFPELVDELRGKPYYITTKMDGTSVTMYYVDGEFGVCGHNYEYKDDGSSAFWRYAHEHDLPEKFADFAAKREDGVYRGDRIILQGEFCSPGINKNRLNLKKPEWFVFNVLFWNDDKLRWELCGLNKMQDVTANLGVQMVPVEEAEIDFSYTAEQLLERAEGKYSSGKQKEGIVIRPVDPIPSPTTGSWMSMKAINNKFLLKGGN